MVEGARLESEYTSKAYRGFESHPLRHRHSNASPEVICLVVVMYVRLPLSLRSVDDMLFERGAFKARTRSSEEKVG